jgi:hypothetical protein
LVSALTFSEVQSDASDDSVQLRLGSDTIARLNVSSELFENEGVQERVAFLDLTDATDEYESPSGGTRRSEPESGPTNSPGDVRHLPDGFRQRGAPSLS